MASLPGQLLFDISNGTEGGARNGTLPPSYVTGLDLALMTLMTLGLLTLSDQGGPYNTHSPSTHTETAWGDAYVGRVRALVPEHRLVQGSTVHHTRHTHTRTHTHTLHIYTHEHTHAHTHTHKVDTDSRWQNYTRTHTDTNIQLLNVLFMNYYSIIINFNELSGSEISPLTSCKGLKGDSRAEIYYWIIRVATYNKFRGNTKVEVIRVDRGYWVAPALQPSLARGPQ